MLQLLLLNRCKDLVEEEDQEFVEEFVGKRDPSILHFLLASGDQVCYLHLRQQHALETCRQQTVHTC